MAITKIKANSAKTESKDKPIKPKKESVKKAKEKVIKEVNNPILKIILKIAGYFKGSWQELKQVRWPNRRATWALTGAVIIFTGFFIILIIALDYVFQLLFKLIIK